MNAIDKELADISYVDEAPPEPTVLVMNVRITDVPGALYPVLKVIDRYNVNISYLNSSADMKGYQDFNIGMVVENPGVSRKILDEVAELYALDVEKPQRLSPLHGCDGVLPNADFGVVDEPNGLELSDKIAPEIFDPDKSIPLFRCGKVHAVNRHNASWL